MPWVLNTITFIKRKRCGGVKARACADGRPQRKIYEKWKALLPTVWTESVLITSAVEAFEKQMMGVYDSPGAFLHAKQTDLVNVKMTGEITAFLMEVSPDTYSENLILEKGRETTRLKKALCGCLKSASLFWQDL
jgi:hypothetical protein